MKLLVVHRGAVCLPTWKDSQHTELKILWEIFFDERAGIQVPTGPVDWVADDWKTYSVSSAELPSAITYFVVKKSLITFQKQTFKKWMQKKHKT